MQGIRKLKGDSGNAFYETPKVYVIRVPKCVVTKETNVFGAMCQVTCLRIIECGRIKVCVCVCVCVCMCVYTHTHMWSLCGDTCRYHRDQYRVTRTSVCVILI